MRYGHPIPVFRIFDEAKAKEFYCRFLGFAVDWQHRFEEGTPVYMQVSLGDCILHLSEHYGDASPGGSVRIDVDDVARYNTVLLEKKYKFARPGLTDTPYHTREMNIPDPFGNKLIFSQDLPAEP